MDNMLDSIISKGSLRWTLADLFYLYEMLGPDKYNKLVKGEDK